MRRPSLFSFLSCSLFLLACSSAVSALPLAAPLRSAPLCPFASSASSSSLHRRPAGLRCTPHFAFASFEKAKGSEKCEPAKTPRPSVETADGELLRRDPADPSSGSARVCGVHTSGVPLATVPKANNERCEGKRHFRFRTNDEEGNHGNELEGRFEEPEEPDRAAEGQEKRRRENSGKTPGRATGKRKPLNGYHASWLASAFNRHQASHIHSLRVSSFRSPLSSFLSSSHSSSLALYSSSFSPFASSLLSPSPLFLNPASSASGRRVSLSNFLSSPSSSSPSVSASSSCSSSSSLLRALVACHSSPQTASVSLSPPRGSSFSSLSPSVLLRRSETRTQAPTLQAPLLSVRGSWAPDAGDDRETEKRLSPLRIDYRQAFELLEKADPTGIKALTAAYNAALHACERQRDRPGALRIYAAMREKEIPIDVVTLHSLFTLLEAFADDTALLQILAQVDSADPESSMAFLSRSPSSSLSPSPRSDSQASPTVSVTPSLLSLGISTCCRAGNATAAVQLMERLKVLLRRNANKFLLNFTSVLPPDTADATAAVAHPPTGVYVQLVVALTQEGRYEEALAYYEELKSLQRRFVEKQQLLEREVARRAELVERELKNAPEQERKKLLGDIERQVVEEQELLLEDYQPPISAVNAALEACLCTGRLKQALLIYKEDVEFPEKQRLRAGEALDQELAPSKAAPTLRTFELLLRACSQQRQAFALAQIWRDFEELQATVAETQNASPFRLPSAAPCVASAIQGFAACGLWTYALRLLLLLHKETGDARQRHCELLSDLLRDAREAAERSGAARETQSKMRSENEGERSSEQKDGDARAAASESGDWERCLEGHFVDLGVEPYLAVLRACRDVGAWKPALGILRLLQQRHTQAKLLHALGAARERREAERREQFQQRVRALRRRLSEAKRKTNGADCVGETAERQRPTSATATGDSDPLLSRDMERFLGSLHNSVAVGRTPLLPEFPYEAYALTLGTMAAAGAWDRVLAVSSEFFSRRDSGACGSASLGADGPAGEANEERKPARRAVGFGGERDEGGQPERGAEGERRDAPLEIRKSVHAYRLMALMHLGRHQEVEAERRSLIRLTEMERRTRERRDARQREREGGEEKREEGKGSEEAFLPKWREETEHDEGEGGEDEGSHGIATLVLEEAETWLMRGVTRERRTQGKDNIYPTPSIHETTPHTYEATHHSFPSPSKSSSASSSSFSSASSSSFSSSPLQPSFIAGSGGGRSMSLRDVHHLGGVSAMSEGLKEGRGEETSVARREEFLIGGGTKRKVCVQDEDRGDAVAEGEANHESVCQDETGEEHSGRSLDRFFAGLEPVSEREARAVAEAVERRRTEEHWRQEKMQSGVKRATGDREGMQPKRSADPEGDKNDPGCQTAGNDPGGETGLRRREGERDGVNEEAGGREKGAPGQIEREREGEHDTEEARERLEEKEEERENENSEREGRAIRAVSGERGLSVSAFLSSVLGPRRAVLESMREEPVLEDTVTEEPESLELHADAEAQLEAKQREGESRDSSGENTEASTERRNSPDREEEKQDPVTTATQETDANTGGTLSQAGGRKSEAASRSESVETSLDLLLRLKHKTPAETQQLEDGPPRWLARRSGTGEPAAEAVAGSRRGVHPPDGRAGVGIPGGGAGSQRQRQETRGQSAFLFAGDHGWGWPPHWEEKLDKARARLQRTNDESGETEENAKTETPWGMRPT
uniref:PPR repeat protein n=1 Tax=Toxoplasma gondii COUG TaxID=1074873 RepID=A0A2G8Y691_TOXGO|nr:PPR repeat protein [Toxoplasma gondii COUG]